MIVRPYKRNPEPPPVAFLDQEGRIVDEAGETLAPEEVPKGTRCYGSWEQVWELVREGVGEALCWNDEEIRFRHRARPEETERWVSRPSDVYVLKLPFAREEVERNVRAVGRWRDWLGRHGAAPTGTTGSAAMSLLRATLEDKLVCGQGMRPPLLQTLGGRQELGPAGRGSFPGPLCLHDLPSAYAAELGGLLYGGEWWPAAALPRPAAEYAARGLPVFVRARVRIPALAYGPLPKRPNRRMRSYLDAYAFGASYPVDGRLQGLWTFQELAAAEAAGARVEKVIEAWVHRSGWRPFAPWWEAIQEGRRMRGYAGALAKLTGNALWGRFAMDPRALGKRGIRRKTGKKIVQRSLAKGSWQYPAHDLAETISGRTRARLFSLMAAAGEDLISAHTDGAWTRAGFDSGPGWRPKEGASRLDLLSPQVLRYWPAPPRFAESGPVVVFAGIPAERAPEAFAEAWEREVERGRAA